jgi:nucleoside-diphosphate-sugar epimerase
MPNFVAITGGAGRVGNSIRPILREHYRIRLLDVVDAPSVLDGDEYQRLDVSDLSAVEHALAGTDAVLHLAADPSTAATWSNVRSANIEATYSVFEAARRNSIKKVILATTNHVMGFYNLEKAWPIDTASPVRPDSLYGVSKAFGEVLARYFSDAFDMSMICLRIGWFTTGQPDAGSLNPLWISTRDIAQVMRLALETPRKFGIYNATSNNHPVHWDLQATRDELGYEPRDDVATIGTNTRSLQYVDPQAGVLRG